ncbi:hypothetical protein C8J57DRAFT_1222648 [Mycena rebaudengoi]|nr:hypothetical protein C8J57DRAFT_1222648 [Mycena rebaudengoi]
MPRRVRDGGDPGDEFKPMQSKADKLERGKRAAAIYYEKNRDDIRVKRRIQMAEKRAAVKAKCRGVGKLPKLDAKLEAAEVTVKAEHRGSGKPLKWSEKLEPAKVELQGQDQASTGLDDQDLEAARQEHRVQGKLFVNDDLGEELPGSDELPDTDQNEEEVDERRPLTPEPSGSFHYRRGTRHRLPTPSFDSPSPDASGKLPSLYDKMDKAYGLDSSTRPF